MYEGLVKKILKKEKTKGEIDISFVNDKEIHGLNLKYRKKDKPTDVLAFPYNQEGMLGDVIISIETTKANAKKYGVTYREELKRLIIHGVLHVLGYDHGKEMRHAEENYQKL